MIFSTPAGKPASCRISPNIRPQTGVFDDGFNTKLFPAAIAKANFLLLRIIGALNGEMPAITPRGRRTAYEKTPSSFETKV